MSKLTLYVNIGCPFARRAMLTARLKALDTTLVPIPLSGQLKKMEAGGLESEPMASALWPGKSAEEIKQVKEDYKRDINATGEVPTLVVKTAEGATHIIAEADVVAEYLEDAYPDSGASLLSKNNAEERSRVRHFLKVLAGDNGVRSMYGLLMNQDPAGDDALKQKIHKGLAEFHRLANQQGPFFLGPNMSLADALLIPFWDQFRFVLPHYRNFEFIPEDTSVAPWVPWLQNWAKAVEENPAFKETRLDKDGYIKAYVGYAGARGQATN
jgi:glutathione S-transferase